MWIYVVCCVLRIYFVRRATRPVSRLTLPRGGRHPASGDPAAETAREAAEQRHPKQRQPGSARQHSEPRISQRAAALARTSDSRSSRNHGKNAACLQAVSGETALPETAFRRAYSLRRLSRPSRYAVRYAQP